MLTSKKLKKAPFAPGWFNGDVDTSVEDRKVVVYTRLHNRETELQHMMKDVPKFKGPFKVGISIHQTLPLSVIEGGRWTPGGYRTNDDS